MKSQISPRSPRSPGVHSKQQASGLSYFQSSINVPVGGLGGEAANANQVARTKQNQQKNECIKVCIRVRPLLRTETGRDELVYYPECADPNLMTIRIADGQHLVESHYDKVFDQYSKQADVFHFVQGKSSILF